VRLVGRQLERTPEPLGCVWITDRGVASPANLARLRQICEDRFRSVRIVILYSLIFEYWILVNHREGANGQRSKFGSSATILP
jgi:hypothetical protein